MATIKDISRVTGIGIATISKYLNGGNVRPKNREAIEKAITELNYSVNVHARGLKTKRSMTIGAVIPELDNVFITTIMSETANVLRKHGYGLIICGCQSDEDQERESVRFLMGKAVDGIINMPINRSGDHLISAVENSIPVVLIDRNVNSLRPKVSSVLVDNVSVSLKATQALLDAGHTRIGIIVGPSDIFTSQQRLLGYNQAHVQSGLMPDPELIVYGNYTVQGGHDAANQLIAKGATALYATNYEMTLGAIISINESGLKIPTDISFVGFDNMQITDLISPKLTIVTQPLKEIGEHAANIMLSQLSASEAIDPVLEILQADIIWGDSIVAPTK